MTTDEMFALGVDGLVSVQSAGRDKGLSTYFTPVRPFSRVRPDVGRQVGAVTETLLANRAAVVFVPGILAVVAVVEVKGQRWLLQTQFQAGRR